MSFKILKSTDLHRRRKTTEGIDQCSLVLLEVVYVGMGGTPRPPAARDPDLAARDPDLDPPPPAAKEPDLDVSQKTVMQCDKPQ